MTDTLVPGNLYELINKKKKLPPGYRPIALYKEPFDAMMSGKKTLEVRLLKGIFERLRIGERLVIKSREFEQQCVLVARITDIATYENLNEAINKVDFSKALPYLDNISYNSIQKEFRRFYSNSLLKTHGIIVFTILLEETLCA